MTDYNWAFYNRNIQSYNDQQLGASLKYGLDDEYVDSQISEDHPIYHSQGALYKETIAFVDFTTPVNKLYYEFEFTKKQMLTFPELMFYLGKNYSAFFKGPYRNTLVVIESAEQIIEKYDLKNCKKAVLREFWYFNDSAQAMDARVMDVGFIPNDSKTDTAVLWVDASYLKSDDLDRIEPLNINGIKNINDYFDKPTFVREFQEIRVSKFERQTKLFKYSTQIDAYFWLAELNHQFIAYTLDSTLKNKWKKNAVKTKQVRGSVTSDKKRTGEWLVYNKEKAVLGKFNFENDVAEGSYKLFHTNGKIKEKGQLLNGVKHGLIVSYDFNGNQIIEQNYKLGNLDGPSVFKYGSGKINTTCTYVQDSLQGDFQRLYEDGSLYIKGGFKDGYAIGNWLFNVRLNDVLCGFLSDEKDYNLLDQYFDEGALSDCTATFEIDFTHNINKDCYRGVCVIPKFSSRIR